MPNQIVLISDDSDFFEFIKTKLELRKSDELSTLSFDEVPDKISSLQTSVLIVNSENSNKKTIDLLKIFNYCTPIIVTAYNDDENFKKKCYRAGMLDFIPLLTPDSEFRARMLPALSLVSILEKNQQYRKLLVKNKILSTNNEVFINYENVMDNAIAEIRKTGTKAVFTAISADNQNKYLINPNSIETFLVNNIRKNDILMKYSHNKYFLIMLNTDLISAQKHWKKITDSFQHELYAGFTAITNQNRQQLINATLIKLNDALSSGNKNYKNTTAETSSDEQNCTNFKLRRKNLEQKLEILISPVFYRIQQKYINKFTGVKINWSYENCEGFFNIKGKHFKANFEISSPGFSKINIDISVQKESEIQDTKRISFTPDEFDETLLEDLLEQFVSEIKVNYCK